MRRQNTIRSGSSLVDLLTAGICLVLLASLAMPYLLQARNSARRDTCINRLRILALAAHNYESAYRQFPLATLGYKHVVDPDDWAENTESDVFWKQVQNTSSLGQMAPFMEMNAWYDKVHSLAFDKSTTIAGHNNKTGEKIGWQGEIPGVTEVMTEFFNDLLCPEDKLGEAGGLAAVIATQPCTPREMKPMGSLDACDDIATQLWPNEDDELGLTNYVGCVGVMGASWHPDDPDLRKWRGVMSPREPVRFRDIRDGSSNTLLFGESLGEINDGQRASAMSWLWGGGARVTGYWPFDAKEHPDDPEIPLLGNEKFSSAVGFGSKHEDGVNFALADGSCREIRRDIDPEVLRSLAGRDDGMVIEGF